MRVIIKNKIRPMRHIWNRLFNLTGFLGKTMWDWLGLLLVPVMILGATGALIYFEEQRENKRAGALLEVERERAEALAEALLEVERERSEALLEVENRRAQVQQQIEDDRVRQSVLQSYIQDMTELLLDKGLATAGPSLPVRRIARSSTLTAVRQLDGDRKGILLQFLYESDLIRGFGPIISLRRADLRDASLSGVNLSGADLSDADLSGANLRFTLLQGIVLSGANLSGADLRFALFLSHADLIGANLSGADLRSADLRGADLRSAYLERADLTSAENWTNQQLAQAGSLVGATMPDGTVMTEEAWEAFKKRYRQ
jgi:Pentapeptide repeats (8 copies)